MLFLAPFEEQDMHSSPYFQKDALNLEEECPECFACCEMLKEPYIRCHQCKPKVLVCLQCFCEGSESGHHTNNHSYEVINNTFSILEENWTAHEEKQLLNALGDCGLGNWIEVAKQMQTKTKEECESHYDKCYIQQAKVNGLPELRCQTDPIYKSHFIATTFQASEDPPRPPLDSLKSVELGGYMPCRGDFEVEYDNYAEFDIKDITLDTSDSLLLKELKLAAVQVFMNRLKERWYRKKIVRRYGLINIKKWQMLERRQDKAERDLRENLRPFAQLQTPDEHEKLIQGIKCAEVFDKLKRRHEDIHGKRKLLDEILIHIRDQKACQTWLQRQALLESGKGLVQIPLPGAARRPAARLDLSGTPGIEILSLEERDLCSSIRLLPLDYLNYKDIFIKENDKVGELRLAQARQLIRIDVNKTRKMYNFFVEKGWICKPED